MISDQQKVDAVQMFKAAEHIRTNPQRRAALQHEAAQHMWWTFLFSFSNVGLAWLSARHGRLDYIGVKCLLSLPFVACIWLATNGKITWTQASYAKTLGSVVTAVYVTPVACHRRKQARLLEGMLSEVDQEEAA